MGVGGRAAGVAASIGREVIIATREALDSIARRMVCCDDGNLSRRRGRRSLARPLAQYTEMSRQRSVA